MRTSAGVGGVTDPGGGGMSVEQDVAAARGAIDELERACSSVTRHFGDTVDARRLRVDITRLREDLTLLCGSRPRPSYEPFAGAIYDDGFDQSMDAPGRRAR